MSLTLNQQLETLIAQRNEIDAKLKGQKSLRSKRNMDLVLQSNELSDRISKLVLEITLNADQPLVPLICLLWNDQPLVPLICLLWNDHATVNEFVLAGTTYTVDKVETNTQSINTVVLRGRALRKDGQYETMKVTLRDAFVDATNRHTSMNTQTDGYVNGMRVSLQIALELNIDA